MDKEITEGKTGNQTLEGRDFDFHDEDWLEEDSMEDYPLAELEQMLEAGNYSEEEAQQLTLQFNLQRLTANLLRETVGASAQPAHLVVNNRSIMTGWVKDGHFHIFDTLTTGLSYRELANESPSYKPIPLEEIQANAEQGHVLTYLA